MPLYLVEGLNCAGKTTFINNVIMCTTVDTIFANPLRWSDSKRKLIKSHNEYLTGIYETILRMPVNGYYYWDRTFISSYIYESISEAHFDYLVDICSKEMLNKPEIIFINTPAEVCMNRLEKLRAKDNFYKNYITCDSISKMKKTEERFYNVMDYLKGAGLHITYTQGDNNG